MYKMSKTIFTTYKIPHAIFTMYRVLPYLLIFVVWFIFSSPYFLKGLSPFPSDYQVNSFSPWSSYKELAGPVKNAAQPDLITQIYPWKNLVIEQWKAGQIPLWNPYSFAGTPLLANFQSAVFSPFNLLFFLPLKFIDSWSILVLLQPLFAGIFTYFFIFSCNLLLHLFPHSTDGTVGSTSLWARLFLLLF